MSLSHKKLYAVAMIVIYSVYIMTALGISILAPQYVDRLHSTVKAYVMVFLLWRFRPSFGSDRTATFNDFDRRVAFHAGTMMLLVSPIFHSVIDRVSQTVNLL